MKNNWILLTALGAILTAGPIACKSETDDQAATTTVDTFNNGLTTDIYSTGTLGTSYDQFGNPITNSSTLGTSYDQFGNLITSGSTLGTSYDQFGNPINNTGLLGTTGTLGINSLNPYGTSSIIGGNVLPVPIQPSYNGAILGAIGQLGGGTGSLLGGIGSILDQQNQYDQLRDIQSANIANQYAIQNLTIQQQLERNKLLEAQQRAIYGL